jgi:UDP-N-acetylmuramate dehydrogenase
VEELITVFQRLLQDGNNYYIFGGGSNLLISDRGLAGGVILMTECCPNLEIDDMKVSVGASVELNKLVQSTINQGITGLERLAGIPGTIGGALRMNAGAYGSEISDCLSTITVLDEGLTPYEMRSAEVGFDYRFAPGLEAKLVLGAQFNFTRRDWIEPAKLAREILELRKSRQPLEFPSAGSVFKRHKEGPAGRFIEGAGLKGLRIGSAEVSSKHANFIINLGNARAIEVLTLIRIVQKRVLDKFNVFLEPEQKLLGFTPEELSEPEKFV